MSATMDVLEMLCTCTRPNSPVSRLTMANRRPAHSISMLAATSGRTGSLTWRVKTEPLAQHTGAASANAAPKRLMRPGPGHPIRKATPPNPITSPTMTRGGRRRPHQKGDDPGGGMLLGEDDAAVAAQQHRAADKEGGQPLGGTHAIPARIAGSDRDRVKHGAGDQEPQRTHQQRRDRLDRELDAEIGGSPEQVDRRQRQPDTEGRCGRP